MGAYAIEYFATGAGDKRTLYVYEDASGRTATPGGFLVEIGTWVNKDPRIKAMGVKAKPQTVVFLTPNTGAQAGKRLMVGKFVRKEFLPDVGFEVPAVNAPAVVKTETPAPVPVAVTAPAVSVPVESGVPVPVSPTQTPTLVTVSGPEVDSKKFIAPGIVLALLLWKVLA